MKSIDSNIAAQNFNHFNSNSQNCFIESDVKLREILQILNRRKFTIILSVMTMLALAISYNIVSPLVYEASALIKKEKA